MQVLKNPDFYRPKTYFLLGAVVCSILSVIVAFVSWNGNTYTLTNLVQVDSKQLVPAAANELWKAQMAFTMAICTGMVAVYGVTIPNQRSKQMQFALFATFPALLQFLLMFQFVRATEADPDWVGMAFPMIAVVLLFVARVFLRAELATLKKADRLWD